jgi:hypothetical protein
VGFQVLIAILYEGADIRSQDQPFRQEAKPSGRCFELDGVSHLRAAVEWYEYVLVPEAMERSAHLLIDKPLGPVERGDPTRQPPRYSKVPRTPGDLIARAEQISLERADGALAR